MIPIRAALHLVLAVATVTVFASGCSRDESKPVSSSVPKATASADDTTPSQSSGADSADRGSSSTPRPSEPANVVAVKSGSGADSAEGASEHTTKTDAPNQPEIVDLGDGRMAMPIRIKPPSRLSLASRDMLTKWAALRGLSATISFEYKRTQPGSRRSQKGTGKIDFLKRGGVVLTRTKSSDMMVIERMPNDFVETGERTDEIFDGEFVYTLQDVHAGKFAFKRRPKPGEVRVIGGPQLLAAIHSTKDLTLAPDELVDGFPTYVFKTRQAGGDVETDYFVDQDTGLLRKLTTRDHRADSELTFTYSDFQIDPTFSEDHFTFVLPDGVALQDSTKSEGGSASSSPTP